MSSGRRRESKLENPKDRLNASHSPGKQAPRRMFVRKLRIYDSRKCSGVHHWVGRNTSYSGPFGVNWAHFTMLFTWSDIVPFFPGFKAGSRIMIGRWWDNYGSTLPYLIIHVPTFPLSRSKWLAREYGRWRSTTSLIVRSNITSIEYIDEEQLAFAGYQKKCLRSTLGSCL